jgi:hypothetical protein
MNKYLLNRWLWKLENSDGLCQSILTDIYVKDNFLTNYNAKPSQSHLWQSLMKVKGLVLAYVGSLGIGEKPLMIQCPRLYSLASRHNVKKRYSISSLIAQ